MNDNIIARRVNIKGLVQGVGFRPFIHRLATRHGLAGWVENRNDGVKVHLEGTEEAIGRMVGCILPEAPAASQVRDIVVEVTTIENHASFEIRRSRDVSDEVTEISPDIAVCEDCLADLEDQPHRFHYPFINCTHCGPRFTIIKDLPYDRDKTTMASFRMCDVCRQEYGNVQDRRFHAQPVACLNCGPHYSLHLEGKTISDFDEILSVLAALIVDGRIIAIKGAGGFHLACDALNDTAVDLLRLRKIRDGKPFAVMFRDIDALGPFVHISPDERASLVSWRRPIVILRNRSGVRLADGISQGFGTTGVMLPYLPVHYMLFKRLGTPAIVMTSDNLSDEPIITGNEAAIAQSGTIADAVLTYNRDIHNRTDDSVVFHAAGAARLIRRSRGFVPEPVFMQGKVDGIFAAGAELVNCFCIGKGRQALMSQHIGDLKNLETLDFYRESAQLFRKIFRAKVSAIACDLHPDYLSTRFAEEWAEKDRLRLIRVQHHHAHVASCMAEHGLDEQVIGIAMDGVGYGDDGAIWGGEFLLCDLQDYRRAMHLEYIPQPGGDKATEEPWRMALACLYQFDGYAFLNSPLPFLDRVSPHEVAMVTEALKNRINTPLTSSTGRLFDAVAALTGVCTHASFHAEAPMRLESILQPGCEDHYPFFLGESIGLKEMIHEIVQDVLNGVPAGVVSAKFHNTLIRIITGAAMEISRVTGVTKAVLSGGTFQNRYLLEHVVKELNAKGFDTFAQEKVPSNDGGLALGQLAVAAKRIQLHQERGIEP